MNGKSVSRVTGNEPNQKNDTNFQPGAVKTSPLFLANSTFFWIVVFYAIANVVWGNLRPLAVLPHTSQPSLELSKAALRFKMDELKTQERPDILLIGSSLPMCAIFYTEGPGYFDLDKGAQIRKLKLNLMQAYPKAAYFTEKLKESTGKEVRVFNFAGAACMASDTKLVLDRCIAANKKPPVIIYGVGLRDFVDNVNPPPGETPYYKSLCNLPFILSHFAESTKLRSFSDLCLSAISNIYELRNDFRTTAEYFACKMLNHPTSIEIAFMLGETNRQSKLAATLPTDQKPLSATGQKPLSPTDQKPSVAITTNRSSSAKAWVSPVAKVQPSNTASTPLSQLDYVQRYTPANYKRLHEEMLELQTLLSNCRKQGIKIVLINMPVSEEHKSLAPRGLRETYLSELRKLSAQATLFVDYEDEQFPDGDFFDTVHLGPKGATKFAVDLSNKLNSSHLLNEIPTK